MIKVINIITTILLMMLILLTVLLAGFKLIGFDTYVVMSGSMEPEYKTGSLIYVKNVDPDTLKKGDVIAFKAGESFEVTHRIIDVTGEGVNKQFTTKGDANECIDPNPVPASNVTGKVIFGITGLGSFVNFIHTPPGLYVFIAIAALLIFLLFWTETLFKNEEKESDIT